MSSRGRKEKEDIHRIVVVAVIAITTVLEDACLLAP
jgi:hypothetical protein